MLNWLRAVLPSELDISNFSTDWNSGVLLSALVDYCKPGLIPDWKNLNPNNGYENCKLAMETAREQLNIPIVLRPEDLASERLDELSGMTYLSYYMNDASAGYCAMINWVRQYLPYISNFTTDWNDGSALCELINKLGGSVDMNALSRLPHEFENNCFRGIMAANTQLGIPKTISSKELSDPDVQALAVMGYLARFQKLTPREINASRKNERIYVRGVDLNNVHVNKAATFEIVAVDPSINVERDVTVEVVQIRNGQRVPVRLDVDVSGGTGSFLPTESTPHELRAFVNGVLAECCPMFIEVFPDISRILYSGIAPCALGSLVEVLINSNGVQGRGVQIEAVSPSEVVTPCEVDVDQSGSSFRTSFVPRTVGEWQIHVTYAREHISGSPFTCYVYDPTKIKLRTPVRYEAGRESQIAVDTKDAGWGKLNLLLELSGRRLPVTCDERGDGLYVFSFHPPHNGSLSVQLSFNDNQIKGSPFYIQVGNEPATSPSGFQFRSELSSAGRILADSPFRDSAFGMTSNGRNMPDSEFILGEPMPRMDRDLITRIQSPSHRILSPQPSLSPMGRRDLREASYHIDGYRSDDGSNRVLSPKLAPHVPDTHGSGSLDRRTEFRLVSEREMSPTSSRLIQTTRSSLTSRVTTPDIIAGHNEPLRPSEDQTNSFAHRLNSTTTVTNITSNRSSNHTTFTSATSNAGSSEVYRAVLSQTPDRALSPEGDLPSGIFRAEYTEGRKTPSSPFERTASPYGRAKTPEKLVENYRVLTGSPSRSPSGMCSPIDDRRTNPYSGVDRTVEIDTSAKKIETKTQTGASSIFDKMDAFFDTPTEAVKQHVTGRTSSDRGVDEVDRKPASPTKDPSNAHDAMRMEFIRSAQNPSGIPKIQRDIIDEALKAEDSFTKEPSTSPLITRTTFSADRSQSPLHHSRTEVLSSPIMMGFRATNSNSTASTYHRSRSMSPSVTTVNTSTPISNARVISPVQSHHSGRVSKEHFVTSTVTRRETTAPLNDHREFEVCERKRETTIPINETDISSPLRNTAHCRQRSNFNTPPPPPPPNAGGSEAKTVRTTSYQTPPNAASDSHTKIPSANISSTSYVSLTGSQLLISPERVTSELKILQPERLRRFPIRQPLLVDVASESVPFDADLLQVFVRGPSGVEYACRVDQLIPKIAQVLIEAREVGDHRIRFAYGGVEMPPIQGHGFSPELIVVDKIPDGIVGRPVRFRINGNGAGSGSLELMVNNGTVGSKVERIRDQFYEASFVPHQATPHEVDIKFNGIPVPGSPWNCNVAEFLQQERILLEKAAREAEKTEQLFYQQGARLLDRAERQQREERVQALLIDGQSMPDSVPCHKRQVLQVQVPPNSKDTDLKVTLLKSIPNAVANPYSVVRKSPTVLLLEFALTDTGTYSLDAHLRGARVQGCPLLFKAYDAQRIHFLEVEKNVEINESVTLHVDASNAGEGQLEISVNRGEVANQVEVLSAGKCRVTFTPDGPGDYVVDIKFNGELIPGCPLTIVAHAPIVYSVDLKSVEVICADEPACFNIPLPLGKRELLRVGIIDPNHQSIPVSLKSSEGDTVIVEFTAKQVGIHVISVDYSGSSVQGSPCSVKCFDPRLVAVEGVQSVNKGETVQFIVDASSSGEGNLEITVSSGSQNVSTQVQPLGGARFAVCFVPQSDALHSVSIDFNGRAVPGSPFPVTVNDAAQQPAVHPAQPGPVCAPVNTPTALLLKGTVHSQHLYARVTNPERSVVPFTLKDRGGDTFAVEFTPAAVGEYRMEVRYQDKPIPGSPFVCKVYDIGQIRVTEVPHPALVGTSAAFLVETAGAGPGNLEVMVNQGRVPTTPQAKAPTLYSIHFTPTEAEDHVIDVRFNGHHVPGSPFTCPVLDLSKLKLVGDPIERVPVHRPCRMLLSAGGQSLINLQAVVVGPNNDKVPLHQSVEGDSYAVEFTPDQVGDYSVDLRLNSGPLLTVPLGVKVYDASKVKVTDISDGLCGSPVYFSIDASAAGAGNLEIIVANAGGRNVPNYVQSEGNARFRVNFKPTESQVHQISIKFNSIPVPGSPFTIHVTDADPKESCDKAHGSQNAVTSGEREPINVSEDFKDIVELDKDAVDTKQMSTSPKSLVNSEALKSVAINTPVTFAVHTKSFSPKNCNVRLQAPDGTDTSANIANTASGFDATFTPRRIGPNQVFVYIDGSQVSGSPFTCNVFDVQRIRVTGLHRGYVGRALTFSVDASQAGEGTLELVVSTKRGSVRAEVSMQARGVYDVTFTPSDAAEHYVNVTFNDLEIPGNPFRIEVLDEKALASQRIGKPTLKGSAAQRGLCSAKNIFDIVDADQAVSIRVSKGSTEAQCVVTKIAERVYRAEYLPREVGSHLLEVLLGGRVATTHNVQVIDPGRVRAMDIEDAIVNRPVAFRVDTTKAGQGTLEVAVSNGGAKVPLQVDEIAVGLYKVTYVPKSASPHKIEIRYNGHAVLGFPRVIQVRDPSHTMIAHGLGLKSAQVGRAARFNIETGSQGDAKDFDIVVSCAGSPLPVRCFVQKDRSLLVEWSPVEIGPHRIEVFYRSDSVQGSPFKCEAFDATRVRLEHDTVDVPKRNNVCNVNQRVRFKLNRRDAGYAELDVTATSPLGKNLPIEVRPADDGELIELTPAVAGKYRIAITYGGVPVPGSPITFIAHPDSSPALHQHINVSGPGLVEALKGIMTSFRVECDAKEGLSAGSPEVSVRGPGGQEAEYTVDQEDDGSWSVSYLPIEVGLYTIRLLMNGADVAGSPYRVRVGEGQQLRPVGGWESVVDSEGTLSGVIGKELTMAFEVPASDSDPIPAPGKLNAEAELPDGRRAPVQIEKMGSRWILKYLPKVSGEHRLHLAHNAHPLAQSPLCIHVHRKSSRGAADNIAPANVSKSQTPGLAAIKSLTTTKTSTSAIKASSSKTSSPYASNSTANKPASSNGGMPLGRVVARGDGLLVSRVGEMAEFFVDASACSEGQLRAMLISDKGEYPVEVVHTGSPTNTFRCQYRAPHPGAYELTVLFDEKHVPGSPFRVRAGPVCDAQRVVCSGEGLTGGIVGKPMKAFLDTRAGGPGELSAHCLGPSKMARCELISHGDGTFELLVTPLESGKHMLSIKYGGQHVPGSPFTIRVAGAPDASRVRVYGPGIEAGVLALYQSRFVCDTRGAGAGQLTVRVRGPKGAFRVEMARESTKDRTILCKYDPTEPGDYRIEVKWSGIHVPGSPFIVLIFDTQDELNRHLQVGTECAS
ncbi:filamin-A-like isoform X1 [Varroa jacobsoni]|uniref:filamin-A-like isoform X1 n=1 Tax=Varroa jacobsoni TaxID=62625 RepID=UPI000BF8B263|nr:filamin-A-like isoform X1 [Varroa jacobsoni]